MMKAISKITLVTLSATLLTSIATAQPYPVDKVIHNLNAGQVTKVKQLGHISSNDSINPIYDAKLERILTAEQNIRYQSLKYGQQNPLKATDFNFNMNSN